MIFHHFRHVGLVELGAGELRKFIFGRLVLSKVAWQLDAKARSGILQLPVGFSVVLHHFLSETLHRWVRSFAFGEFSQFDFRHTALSSFCDETSLLAVDRSGSVA